MISVTTSPPLAPFVPSVFLDAPRWNHAGLPEWFIASQLAAWEQFPSLPMPTRKIEAWRFSNLGLLQFDDYRRSMATDATPADWLADSSARLCFVNDHIISREVNAGVMGIMSLREAVAKDDPRLRAALATAATGLGSEKFAALHQAHLQDAVIIIIPANEELAGPVHIRHILTEATAVAFPRTIVIAGANSKVTILEEHSCEHGGWFCGAAQIITERGANVSYTLINSQSEAGKSLHFSKIEGAADAHVKHLLVNVGGGWVRTECVSHEAGAGSRCDMLSASITSGQQEIDQRTLQDHISPHTGSDLLYKNVLLDKSRTIFAGLIKVAVGAHFTDAYQKCRNLLLSDDCEANSMPGLEINADQVRCSHGSTSGRLSEEEMFYLNSRGIPSKIASFMICLGFATEVIQRLENEALATYLIGRLEDRLAALEADHWLP